MRRSLVRRIMQDRGEDLERAVQSTLGTLSTPGRIGSIRRWTARPGRDPSPARKLARSCPSVRPPHNCVHWRRMTSGRFMHRLARRTVLIVLLLVAALTRSALGQEPDTSAIVRGVVRDPAGMGIPGVQIILTHLGSRATFRTQTVVIGA